MSQLYVDNIRNRTGGPIGIPTGAVVTGVVTATTGNITGNLTVGGNADITGVLTYEDVTNVDSVGVVTARSGIEFGASGVGGTITATGQAEFAGVCTATSFSGSFDGSTASFSGNVSIADSIFHTGDTDTSIRFPAANTFTVETAGSERLRIASDGRIGIGMNPHASNTGYALQIDGGASSFIQIFNDTSGNTVNDGLVIGNDANTAYFVNKENTPLVFRTNNTERLRITSTGGVHFSNAELIERVNIVANKLSAVPNVNLDNGMVHYYTTNETTTANPNIITTAGINTNMATGDTMSVTIMSKPNNAGYFPRISIDGRLAGITTYWNGGSAPSSAESSGVDVNTYQIIKTADETFDVLANTSNFA